MLEMVKFLTDMMHKLVPALNKLQEYLTNIGELNLVANQEFHSVSFIILFYFILFYFILFYFILFYFILYFILFYFIYNLF